MEKISNSHEFLSLLTSKNELFTKAINGINFKIYHGKIHTS